MKLHGVEVFYERIYAKPAFMMVLCVIAPFAYKREDGVFVVPISCLKD